NSRRFCRGGYCARRFPGSLGHSRREGRRGEHRQISFDGVATRGGRVMLRPGHPVCSRSALGRLAACGLILAVIVAPAPAAEVDRDRAAAARALAQRYWREAGLDKLPERYDDVRFEKAVGGEDDPYNIVAAIAVATLTSNPERKESVIRYLNESLLPFARSH